MNPVKESEITMASVEKFSAGAVRNQLRHNRREIEHSGNPDIDRFFIVPAPIRLAVPSSALPRRASAPPLLRPVFFAITRFFFL